MLFGALILSSSSVFVSCADYDDDINANKAEIVAAQTEIAKLTSSLSSLQTELQTVKAALEKELGDVESTFNTKIADAEANLKAAIAAKADQATVDNLIAEVNKLKADFEANKAAIQAKIDAIDASIQNLKELIATKADQSALDAAIQTLQAAINGKVDKETFAEATARISALETQLASLKDLVTEKAALTELQAKIELVNKDIDALKESLKDKVSTEAFNSLKTVVDGIQATLADVQSTLASKADKTTVDALKADLQAKIDALTEAQKNFVTAQQFELAIQNLEALITALQNSDTKNQADIAALQALVATIQTALADKADKADVEAALQSLRNEVAALVDSKADKTEIIVINNLIEKLEANKADKTEVEALNKALEEAVALLNEDIAAKYAELNGRIDKAFEDLGEMREDIADILVEIAATNGSIDEVEKKFDKLIADLQAADKTLDGKIAKLQGIVDGHLEAYKVAMAALDQQIDALKKFDEAMDKRAGEIEENLKNASAELKKQIQDEEAARKAAIEEVKGEIQKTNADIATKYAELKKLIADNDASYVERFGKVEDRVTELEKQFTKINDLIDARIKENVSSLCVFVSKTLKSISLVPQLYVGGIEAIEFNSLTYTPLKPGTSGLGDQALHAQFMPRAAAVRVDNGTAEAYYNLSPAIIDRASIDEENIVYKSAIAETRATDPYLGTNTPVKFAGIAEWNVEGQKGLIKVNLKKTITGSLNRENDNEVYIVNLNVPRKETTVAGNTIEAAMITSENHMLVENEFTPKIAWLPWGNSLQTIAWGGLDGTKDLANYRYHHLTDSVTMWHQKVDFDPDHEKYHMVYATVNYNETFDVLAHVTGCRHEEGTPKDQDESAGIQQTHDKALEMTKEQLKSYGLEFRFAIPTTEYKQDVDHSTDQQQFAQIDSKTGVVSSKIPSGWTNNRACVGKEPIIRVMLIDVNNGNLVDERYLKIKWVEPTKGTIEMEPYKCTTKLKPCDVNEAVSLTWKHVINEIYAKVVETGMSQKTFESVYLTKNPTFSKVSMYWDYDADAKSGTKATNLSLLQAADEPDGPAIYLTTNEQGDAVIAAWDLNPAQIANIYPHQQKVFVCEITFNSTLPTEYPNLKMRWIWTITLPTLPSLNGYYDNYWFTKYTLHDVMAVQYNTAQYNLIKDGTITPGKAYGSDAPLVGMQIYDKANNAVQEGKDYCVFYNNITNAFTYELNKQNVPQFIVKNLVYDCDAWDMQFTMKGKDFIENSITYTQADGYRPASNTASPSLNKIGWQTAGAYKLETTSGAQALQLEWWGQMDHATGAFDQGDEGHEAWDGLMPYNYAMLYADHHNEANQKLLNKIIPDAKNPIGKEPERTHDTKVHMGIWGTLNDWNIIPIKDYDFCLVEPLAINAQLGGAFEEGYVSGTCLKCDDAFTMTDFRGYEVANKDAGTTEWTKYRKDLYIYYEVETPVWELDKVKYGMKPVGGDVVADDDLTYANSMTAADISTRTNGNIRLSVEEKDYNGTKYLVFKNNGGSNVEEEVNIFIPVTAKYGFGQVQKYCKVRLYPKGKVAAGVTIVPYPGN